MAACARERTPDTTDAGGALPLGAAASERLPAIASAVPSSRARAPDPPGELTRYPFDSTHSPIDARVRARLQQIRARNPRLDAAVFAKIGDSITASGDFMHCFARPRHELGSHAALLPTIERYRRGNAAGIDPFRRQSLAAAIGISAWRVVSERPSLVEREIDAVRPELALVMFGTNDVEAGSLHYFADRMLDVVDQATSRGVVPILFTIPRRRDRRDRDVWVPRYNTALRAIAQARQIPLVDYHRELLRLPNEGLAKDGIHPSTRHGKYGRDACALDADGLRHGYNLRNLLALQALDRASRALRDGSFEADAAPPEPDGNGSKAQPFRIPRLPFVDVRTVGAGWEHGASAGQACPSRGGTPGQTLTFELELDTPKTVYVYGFDSRGAEVDLQLADSEGKCLTRAERILEHRAERGRHRLILEARNTRGETLLVVFAE
jgi:hypothetical protein